MKKFVQLYKDLDQTTKTNQKIDSLVRFFQKADDPDKVWAIALFSHRRPKRTVNLSLLREWAAEKATIPQWLFEESYHTVGDLAETIALLLPKPQQLSNRSLTQWISLIKEQRDKSVEEKKEFIMSAWNELEHEERFLFCKLITGGFRLGVSQKTVVKALSRFTGKEENQIAHRLMGNWIPGQIDFESLILKNDPKDNLSRPYPFYLAYALNEEFEDLGSISEWLLEWKWDGIRGQVIKREGQLFVWSRGEELVTEKYPEFQSIIDIPADNFVLDGEILPFKDGKPLSFQELQTRIGRKNVSKNLLSKTPVVFMVYDIMEFEGTDVRSLAIEERKKMLESLFGHSFQDTSILISERVSLNDWSEAKEKRELSRSLGTEGFMLKKLGSEYKTGRKKGEWWKWKVDPMTVDAIMIYAMRGHGRRSNLYTDFTFAVWDEDKLVPFAKAYSGLTDAEFREINQYIRRNTLDRFGPVRAVKPELVFEIAFEGINRSKRHKSGIAVRFPRIIRWRKDKHPKEANRLEDLHDLILVK